MEEVIGLITQLWGELWSNASTFERALMVMNVIGSTYTFIVALLTIRKIDEVEKGRTTVWEIISKIALVCTLISCMYSGIFTHIPELYEFMGSLSATTLLTSIYINLRKK